KLRFSKLGTQNMIVENRRIFSVCFCFAETSAHLLCGKMPTSKQATMHPETLDRICNSLLRDPYAVVDNFLSEETLFGIVEYMDNLFGQGEFHQAQIGKGLEKQKATEIRSDKVFWIPKDIDNLAVGEYLKEMESLRE